MENSESGNVLIVGWLLGIFCFSGLFFALFQPTEELESSKIITPEIILTTDGKKVDTIYVYKVNQK